jgi:hypothetical protein
VFGRLLLPLLSLQNNAMNGLKNILCLDGSASGRTDGHAHVR